MGPEGPYQGALRHLDEVVKECREASFSTLFFSLCGSTEKNNCFPKSFAQSK